MTYIENLNEDFELYEKAQMIADAYYSSKEYENKIDAQIAAHELETELALDAMILEQQEKEAQELDALISADEENALDAILEKELKHREENE